MHYAVQRYAATRPWARRVGQVYGSSVDFKPAWEECMALVKRELERAGQVFQLPASVLSTEQMLADAYGHFCRHGRVVSHLEPVLSAALGATRLPSNMPDRLNLPADAFFLHVEGGAAGGAFVLHDKVRQQLLILLLRDDFSRNGDWLAGGDSCLSLSISYPGELAPQIEFVPDAWSALLAAVLNGFAIMTQPKATLERGWEAAAPIEIVQRALRPDCFKTRKKNRAELLKAGYQEVSFCRMAELAEAPAGYQTQGYWRRQASEAGSRLVWVAPRQA